MVGPLTREEVAALATLADGRATTLALNFLPDGVQVPDRFYQYALSPEDEARLAARRIVADGRTSGVALAPQSDWGRRVQAAFAEEFAAAGGQLVDQADYAAFHGGLQRDRCGACCARPASAAAARAPTRSSSSSPRSRCTAG